MEIGHPGDKTLIHLIGLIYESVEDSSAWALFLEHLRRIVAADVIGLHVHNAVSRDDDVAAQIGLEPHFVAAYASHFHSVNILVQRAAALTSPGDVVTSEEICDNGVLRRSEYYNDFLRPQKLLHVLGSAIATQSPVSSFISLLRSEQAGPYKQWEADILGLAIPHLQRAVHFVQCMNALGAKTTALDAMGVGVLLVDAFLRITYANPQGEAILARKDGLESLKNRLVVQAPLRRRELELLVMQSSQTSAHSSTYSGGLMLIDRPSLRRPYAVTVSPTNSKLSWDNRKPTAILSISDPEAEPNATTGVLCRLYGLTSAEARLANILARGNDLDEACEELQIKRTTARTHLKSIFQKVGVRRQSELVAVCHRSLGHVRTQT